LLLQVPVHARDGLENESALLGVDRDRDVGCEGPQLLLAQVLFRDVFLTNHLLYCWLESQILLSFVLFNSLFLFDTILLLLGPFLILDIHRQIRWHLRPLNRSIFLLNIDENVTSGLTACHAIPFLEPGCEGQIRLEIALRSLLGILLHKRLQVARVKNRSTRLGVLRASL